MSFVSGLLVTFPLTTHTGDWFAPNAAVGVAVVGLFAIYGLRAALTPAMPGPLVARPRVDEGRAT